MKRFAVLLAVASLASGCMTTKAATPVERPVLDVPPVPPRVIEPAPAPELPNPEPVPNLAPEKPATTTSKPRPIARDTTRESPKPENAKPDPPPVEQPPLPPVTQPPPVKPAASADAAAADRRIRDSLLRTEEMLRNIDYRKLKPERQAAYDQAKSHIDGADVALKASNFDLAKEMAEKAEKLAKELQSR